MYMQAHQLYLVLSGYDISKEEAKHYGSYWKISQLNDTITIIPPVYSGYADFSKFVSNKHEWTIDCNNIEEKRNLPYS